MILDFGFVIGVGYWAFDNAKHNFANLKIKIKESVSIQNLKSQIKTVP
jgi:hypothetical protein